MLLVDREVDAAFVCRPIGNKVMQIRVHKLHKAYLAHPNIGVMRIYPDNTYDQADAEGITNNPSAALQLY